MLGFGNTAGSKCMAPHGLRFSGDRREAEHHTSATRSTELDRTERLSTHVQVCRDSAVATVVILSSVKESVEQCINSAHGSFLDSVKFYVNRCWPLYVSLPHSKLEGSEGEKVKWKTDTS